MNCKHFFRVNGGFCLGDGLCGILEQNGYVMYTTYERIF